MMDVFCVLILSIVSVLANDCAPCYSGINCEINNCPFVTAARIFLLLITGLLGIFAIAMFFYRIKVVSNEEQCEPRQIEGTSLASSCRTSCRGKDSLVIHSKPSVSDSVCSMIYNSMKSGQEADYPINNDLKQRVIEWSKKNAKRNSKSSSAKKERKRRRMPPWDEIEMRRHGLVSRFCDRVYHPDCPSNPSTVDVSTNLTTATGSTGVINFNQPLDSSSDTTPMPTATSTPKIRRVSRSRSRSRSNVVQSTQPSVTNNSTNSVYVDPSLADQKLQLSKNP
uniref:Uncharacterized protein n=1 Tax=Panagrolaimus sp. JU765 TaxID=591449 RepID=A0AC34R409_9BILA